MGERSSLFSFEVAVKTIFLKRAIVCHVPMVAVRLLDYPTLELNLITADELQKIKGFVENSPNSIRSPQILELQHSTGTYSFTQGKSCLIKTKLSELEESLLNIPVYVMLMDILPSVPKLVASFALSLDSVIRKIVRDVSENGIEVPSGQGERDIYPLYNLMGNKVGEAEMGVRLTSLGIMMLQHVSDIAQPERSNSQNETQRASSALKISNSAQTDVLKNDTKDSNNESNKENINKIQKSKSEKQTDSTQTSKIKTSSKYAQIPVKPVPDMLGSTENIFCPPALYYDKKSDVTERKLYDKQQKAAAHRLRKVDKTLSMSDLENEDKVIVPSSIMYQSPSSRKKFSSNHTTQTDNNAGVSGIASKLGEFPILKALVEEVARLGFQGAADDVKELIPHDSVKEKEVKVRTKPWVNRTPKTQRKYTENKSEQKQPLRFGLTNTMRLRMAITKANMKQQKELNSTLQSKRTPKATKQSSTLGRTFIKRYPAEGKKNTTMVTRASGPDNSMYRRFPHQNVNQQTVYLGRMAGYEEATDFEVPSLGHMASDSPLEQVARTKVDDIDMEGLMIVKDVRTPRAHSRQSQRSIEIHLPTASTEFTIGRDDDGEWESTVSDKEKLEEAMKKAREQDFDDNEPEFYTPPESTDTSRPQSSLDIYNDKKQRNDGDKIPPSDVSASENYKYSDDFEDDKTWSANRTPSAMTPINSTMIIKEESEEDENDYRRPIAPYPSKSMDSTITTTMPSDFTDSYGEEVIRQIDELKSASAQRITSSDDAIETSSVSRGSIVTALMGTKSRTDNVKVGSITVPGPIPSDSPVIQSMQSAESASMSVEHFPLPKKHSLTSKSSARHKKKSSTKTAVHLPKTIENKSSPKSYKNSIPNPKYSRMTPSPPSTRRMSPISSPESSKERMRRMYHHPGRRTRHTSSGSGSPDFDKPMSPLRRSDSVSSYQPSEISDVSNVRLSEDLENLSDILSEEPDSQNGFHSSDDDVPSDLPKTFFGKPKLDPKTKLGYTT